MYEKDLNLSVYGASSSAPPLSAFSVIALWKKLHLLPAPLSFSRLSTIGLDLLM